MTGAHRGVRGDLNGDFRVNRKGINNYGDQSV